MTIKKYERNMKPLNMLLELLLISAATVYGLQKFYYLIFPWVLGHNEIYPLGTLTPWVEAWNTQRDGIEVYVLYMGMFLNIIAVIALASLFRFVENKWARGLLLAFALILSFKLILGIRFSPPSEVVVVNNLNALMYCGLFGILILALIHYQKRISLGIETWLVCGLLILFCFVPTGSVGNDVAYIFSPAQKLLEGTVGLEKIYFQYGLLLSLIAALWMQLGFKLYLFVVLCEASFFFGILGIFLISRDLFKRRWMSLLLLIAILVVRFASAPWFPPGSFQTTPLRLDLWLILFAIIYLRGPSHWLLPVFCGALIMLHGSFGLIYTIGYLQVVITMSALSILDHGFKVNLEKWRTPSCILKIVTTGCYLLACYFLTRVYLEANIEATSYYQKIGIGFIPIDVHSFFWIFPVIVPVLFVLLFKMRNLVSAKYVALGFSLTYFALGNCIYFFGRSHELNLFSISIPLIFVLFFILDLVDRYLHIEAFDRIHNAGRIYVSLVLGLGILFILAATYKCSDQIKKNISSRFDYKQMLEQNHGDMFSNAQMEAADILKEVRGIIDPLSPILFMVLNETKEFSFYNIEPGNKYFFYPLKASVFLDEFIQHAQSALDAGGYLLLDEQFMKTKLDKRLNGVGFRYLTQNGSYVLIAKTPPDIAPGKP